MKINDPERFARELRGDFSEVDVHLKAQRTKLILAAAVVALCTFLYWLLTKGQS